MRVLVIGGTTFFGKALVADLLEEGHEVALFSRGQKQPPFYDQVEAITGDRNDPEDVAAKLGGRPFDAVVDNIAFTEDDVQQALEVFQGNVGRYVLTSTAAVYYTSQEPMPVDETAPDFGFEPPADEADSPLWRYTLGKLGAERVLLEQDALAYTILRPPIVLGPEDPSLRGYFYIQRLLDGRPMLLTNGGVQSFRLAYSRDLAYGYRLALASERASHAVYNINQPEIIQLTDLIDAAAEALGLEPDLVPVPPEALQQADWDYPETYAPVQNFVPDVGKAQRELGFTATPFRDWMAETARWYRDVYGGEDSRGYADRDREVAFAEAFRKALAGLGD